MFPVADFRGIRVTKDLPFAIMVEFGGYKGPFWEDTRTVPVFLATTRFRHNTLTTITSVPNSLWWYISLPNYNPQIPEHDPREGIEKKDCFRM